MGRTEVHTGHSRSANRAWSACKRQAWQPAPPCQAATLTAQWQCKQGSSEPMGSPLWYSRPFRKQPIGKGHLRPSLGVPHCPCPGLHGRPDLSRPYSLSPSGLHPLTHHHTQGSRCLGGAGQGMGTGWCILAGGTGCGPPGTRQSGQDKGPSELSQLTETVLSPAIHLLDIVMT